MDIRDLTFTINYGKVFSSCVFKAGTVYTEKGFVMIYFCEYRKIDCSIKYNFTKWV